MCWSQVELALAEDGRRNGLRGAKGRRVFTDRWKPRARRRLLLQPLGWLEAAEVSERKRPHRSAVRLRGDTAPRVRPGEVCIVPQPAIPQPTGRDTKYAQNTSDDRRRSCQAKDGSRVGSRGLQDRPTRRKISRTVENTADAAPYNARPTSGWNTTDAVPYNARPTSEQNTTDVAPYTARHTSEQDTVDVAPYTARPTSWQKRLQLPPYTARPTIGLEWTRPLLATGDGLQYGNVTASDGFRAK